ncbi:hypothetical protein [Aliiruegeria lutimaris]|nr:hypothetical protein [Aliiruegeria lutimaris]
MSAKSLETRTDHATLHDQDIFNKHPWGGNLVSGIAAIILTARYDRH